MKRPCSSRARGATVVGSWSASRSSCSNVRSPLLDPSVGCSRVGLYAISNLNPRGGLQNDTAYTRKKPETRTNAPGKSRPSGRGCRTHTTTTTQTKHKTVLLKWWRVGGQRWGLWGRDYALCVQRDLEMYLRVEGDIGWGCVGGGVRVLRFVRSYPNTRTNATTTGSCAPRLEVSAS